MFSHAIRIAFLPHASAYLVICSNGIVCPPFSRPLAPVPAFPARRRSLLIFSLQFIEKVGTELEVTNSKLTARLLEGDEENTFLETAAVVRNAALKRRQQLKKGGRKAKKAKGGGRGGSGKKRKGSPIGDESPPAKKAVEAWTSCCFLYRCNYNNCLSEVMSIPMGIWSMKLSERFEPENFFHWQICNT